MKAAYRWVRQAIVLEGPWIDANPTLHAPASACTDPRNDSFSRMARPNLKEMEGDAANGGPDVATVPGSTGGADPSSALVNKRDAVLRRWLGMEVERSSVGELAERPLSDRLRELEELFDAAVLELRDGHGGGRGPALDLR